MRLLVLKKIKHEKLEKVLIAQFLKQPMMDDKQSFIDKLLTGETTRQGNCDIRDDYFNIYFTILNKILSIR